MKTYAEKLKDPRWQRKRLEIMQRDDFECLDCGDKDETLHVHHLRYNKDPWDADDSALVTLCKSCHDSAERTKLQVKSMMETSHGRGVLDSIMRLLMDLKGTNTSALVVRDEDGEELLGFVMIDHSQKDYCERKREISRRLSKHVAEMEIAKK